MSEKDTISIQLVREALLQSCAPGIATEDVLYLLQGLGIETGIDLDRLIAAGQRISQVLGRPTGSRVARARSAQ